jgi:hypothetical protein
VSSTPGYRSTGVESFPPVPRRQLLAHPRQMQLRALNWLLKVHPKC